MSSEDRENTITNIAENVRGLLFRILFPGMHREVVETRKELDDAREQLVAYWERDEKCACGAIRNRVLAPHGDKCPTVNASLLIERKRSDWLQKRESRMHEYLESLCRLGGK